MKYKRITISLPIKKLEEYNKFSKATYRTFSGLVNYALSKLVRQGSGLEDEK